MIEIIEDFLDNDQKQIIEDIIYGKKLPLYYYQDSVDGDGKSFLCHVLIKRPEDRTEGDIGSDGSLVVPFLSCLSTYHRKYHGDKNIEVQILRAAVNLCIANGSTEGVWHHDHEYPHKHFILYLNDPQDKHCVTEIMDGDEVYKVYPQKWKAVVMDDHSHRAIYPTVGDRWVLVITYLEREFDPST